MDNESIRQVSWFRHHWKSVIPAIIIIFFSIVIFLSSGLDGITANLTKAYTDPELYKNALEKVKSDEKVIQILGEIEVNDKFTILEGSMKYSSDNKTLNSSIRLKGAKGKGMLDITASRVGAQWDYEKINVRIQKPSKNKQTSQLITLD